MKDLAASSTRFPARLTLRTPEGLSEALEVAAAEQHSSSPSDWARQCLLRGLADVGIRVLPDGEVERRPAAGASA